jgi:protein-tyrosine phosphatase/membrane-associated phospholipid phosphatase
VGNLQRVVGPTPVARLGWFVLCSVTFLVVYGGTNWITAQRSDVGTWYFAWEMQIPFVPWMIVPYWSIDLFFLGSFFVCRDRRELDVHAKRILFAFLVAGACFLLWPLRIAFPRPEVPGVFGVMFTALRMCDQPHNLFPSLHITLWLILRAVYARHTRGALQCAVKLWFVLVGVSTLLIWQHHVVDLLGGFGLAAICFYLIRESPWRLPVVPNLKIGSCYAAGSAASLALAALLWPGGGIFLWVALALGIVAAGYAGVGPAIYRKHEGRIPLSAKLLLGPVLVGQQLSLLYYCRQCRPWDEVTPRVWLGRVLNRRVATEARLHGVTAVLDLTAEFSETPVFLDLGYRNIPILDLTAPTQEQLHEAARFIAEHARDGVVYVHCKIGYTRSAAAVGAYLLASGKAKSTEEAVAMLRAARPSIVVRAEAMSALQQFAMSV